jgi:TP901-1 family phage major tail protein
MEKATPTVGKDVMVFIDKKATALATSCSLSMTASTSEAASKDDGIWENSTVTKIGWEIRVEAFVSTAENSYDKMNAAFKARQPIEVVYGKVGNPSESGVPEGGWTEPTTNYEKGSALITSLERNDPNGDNSTFSATLKGVGELKTVTA